MLSWCSRTFGFFDGCGDCNGDGARRPLRLLLKDGVGVPGTFDVK